MQTKRLRARWRLLRRRLPSIGKLAGWVISVLLFLAKLAELCGLAVKIAEFV
jgi:hypothetical protein